MAEKVQFKSESFEVQEAEGEDEGKIVTGLALPYDKTSRNGVAYQKESVEKNMDKMEGRSVLVNHDMDRPIGHVEQVQSTDKGMVYKMNIDPEEKINNTSAIRKFERGDVKNVSISAFVERVEGEDNLVAVKDFAELSAVTVPGFPETTTNPEQAPQGMLAAESIEEWAETYQSEEDDFGDGGDNDDSTDVDDDDVKSDEPFAGYDDFEACVADNRDKRDPEAYCAALKDKAEDVAKKFKSKDDENSTMTDNKSEAFSLDNFESAAAQMLADAADVETSEFSDVMEDYEFEVEASDVADFVAAVTDKSASDVMDFAGQQSDDEPEDEPEDDESEVDGDKDDGEDDDMDEESFVEVGDEKYSKEEVVEALKSEDDDGESEEDADDGESNDEDGSDESEDESFGDGSSKQNVEGSETNETREDFGDVDMPEF